MVGLFLGFFFLLLMLKWNFLCFNVCPLPLVISLGTTKKSLAPSSLLPQEVFMHIREYHRHS